MDDNTHSPDKRRDKILELLNMHDRCSVGELSQLLSVSEVTIRKDLDLLESQGMLTRVHGGAMASGRGRLEHYFAAREQEHLEEKRRIAQAAVNHIHPGQRIFLDASTTALQIARLIKDYNDLVVVTNGLYTALELNFSEGISTIVVGGVMRRRSSSLVGNMNYNSLQRLRVDLGFFGARAVSAQDGLMETDLDEAQVKQRMVESSLSVIGVVDSSKFSGTALNAFALPHELTRVITDAGAPIGIVQGLRDQQVEVEIV